MSPGFTSFVAPADPKGAVRGRRGEACLGAARREAP